MLKAYKIGLLMVLGLSFFSLLEKTTFAAGETAVNIQPTQIKNTNTENGMPTGLFDNTPLTPTKVFDNLYCIGTKSVVAWVLQTSDGFILIDAMWDNNDAKLIIDGMQKLGLNPEKIKIIILTHGHGDHYGGAQYIKDKYHAKILMSQTDYNYMNTTTTGANSSRSPKCVVDSYVKDGQKIKLGDTKVTIVATPGHTPGGISLIFPVKQDRQTFMVGQWGGTGAPKELAAKKEYRRSIDYFEKYTKAAHVTVEITAHLFSENGYAKLDAARTRKTGEKNPFTLGEAGFANYLNELRATIEKAIAGQEQIKG